VFEIISDRAKLYIIENPELQLTVSTAQVFPRERNIGKKAAQNSRQNVTSRIFRDLGMKGDMSSSLIPKLVLDLYAPPPRLWPLARLSPEVVFFNDILLRRHMAFLLRSFLLIDISKFREQI
jgi:hypothetical protein